MQLPNVDIQIALRGEDEGAPVTGRINLLLVITVLVERRAETASVALDAGVYYVSNC